MKKVYFLAAALCMAFVGNAQTVIYSNTFEGGVGDATIVGNGTVVTDASPAFGQVFHNAAGGQAIRTNYLLLPTNVLGAFNSANTGYPKELTVAFWVNKGTATGNFWTPIFSAYGAAPATVPAGGTNNTFPMMILQSRLVSQVNCAGWTDLTDADNVATVNTASVEWLDDNAWHYFTATFTETKVKVMVDGVVKNEWNCNGTAEHTVNGLFSNGFELDYVCLGGNQAWGWNDVDPAYKFDDVTLYSSALTSEQITANMTAKLTPTAVKLIGNAESSELVGEEYYSINGKKVASEYRVLTPGIYIKKSVYKNGEVKSEKVVKNGK